jgi:hypothetical protein
MTLFVDRARRALLFGSIAAPEAHALPVQAAN